MVDEFKLLYNNNMRFELAVSINLSGIVLFTRHCIEYRNNTLYKPIFFVVYPQYRNKPYLLD